MGKIKLTKDQVTAIKRIERGFKMGSVDSNVQAQINKDWKRYPFKSLNQLSTSEFLTALFGNGYELKGDEFKEGDWISSEGVVEQITEINKKGIHTLNMYIGFNSVRYKKVKFATKQEIVIEEGRMHSQRKVVTKEEYDDMSQCDQVKAIQSGKFDIILKHDDLKEGNPIVEIVSKFKDGSSETTSYLLDDDEGEETGWNFEKLAKSLKSKNERIEERDKVKWSQVYRISDVVSSKGYHGLPLGIYEVVSSRTYKDRNNKLIHMYEVSSDHADTSYSVDGRCLKLVCSRDKREDL